MTIPPGLSGLVLLPLYVLLLALVGLPLLLLEVGLGQFTGRGVWSAWNVTPLFKGTAEGIQAIHSYEFVKCA